VIDSERRFFGSVVKGCDEDRDSAVVHKAQPEALTTFLSRKTLPVSNMVKFQVDVWLGRVNQETIRVGLCFARSNHDGRLQKEEQNQN
jgi:hypothetical protein